MRLGEMVLHLERRELVREGAAVELSPLEAALLGYLGERPGETVSRDELLQQVWGYAPGVSSRAVDHTVRRLRQKLGDDARRPTHLVSVYGGGYRLEGLGPSVPETPVVRPAPTGVVGRDALLVRLRGSLVVGAALVLTGPGGVGKTTLARALVGELGGVFVELANARSTSAVAVAVGAALGVPLGRTEAITRLRLARGAPDQGLVVLDNLEQLDDAALELLRAVVAEWSVPVLATSRTRVGLGGTSLAVPPLPRQDAVELLRRAAPEADDGALGRVAELLEGMPLALRLASSRLATVGLDALIEHVEASNRWLVAPGEGLPARHRAVDASVAWTWSLLDEADRAVLRGLCVFVGGGTLPALGAVLGDDQVVDRVDALMGASVLTTTEGPSGPRLRPWNAVRSWLGAHGHLDGLDERRHAHARWLAAGARKVVEGPHGAIPGPWLRAELADVGAAALRVATSSPEDAVLLARAYLEAQHLLPVEDIGEVVTTVLRTADGSTPGRLALQVDWADLLRRRGMQPPSPEEATAWLARAEELGAPTVVWAALRLRAHGLRMAGRVDEADADLARAVATIRPTGDRVRLAVALDDRALLRARRDQGPDTLRLHLEALAALEGVEAPAVTARILGNTALRLRAAGRLPEAREMNERALACLEAEDSVHRAVLLQNLGNLALEADDVDQADAYLARAVALHRRLGDAKSEGLALGSRGGAHLLAGRPEQAEVAYRAAAMCLEDSGDGRALAWVRGCLGHVAFVKGDHGRAASVFREGAEALDRAGAASLGASFRWLHVAACAASGETARARHAMADAPAIGDDPEPRVCAAFAAAHLARAEGHDPWEGAAERLGTTADEARSLVEGASAVRHLLGSLSGPSRTDTAGGTGSGATGAPPPGRRSPTDG